MANLHWTQWLFGSLFVFWTLFYGFRFIGNRIRHIPIYRVPLKEAALYLVYESGIHLRFDQVSGRYGAAMLAANYLFEMAGRGELTIYGRRSVDNNTPTGYFAELGPIPKEICRELEIREDHFRHGYIPDDPVLEAETSIEKQMEHGYNQESGKSNKDDPLYFYADLQVRMRDIKKIWKPSR